MIFLVWIFCLHVSMYMMLSAWWFCSDREGDRLPLTGVMEGWESSCGFWKLNLGPLEEQPVLFTAELSLQHHDFLRWILFYVLVWDLSLLQEQQVLITTEPLSAAPGPAMTIVRKMEDNCHQWCGVKESLHSKGECMTEIGHLRKT